MPCQLAYVVPKANSLERLMRTHRFFVGVCRIEPLHKRHIVDAGEVIFDAGPMADEGNGCVSFKCAFARGQDACKCANQSCFARAIGTRDYGQSRWIQAQINGLKDGFAVTMKADLAGNEIRLHDIAK